MEENKKYDILTIRLEDVCDESLNFVAHINDVVLDLMDEMEKNLLSNALQSVVDILSNVLEKGVNK